MNMTKSLAMSLVAVVGFSSVGCSPGTLILMAALGGKKEKSPTMSEYGVASCAYKFDEGPVALARPANKLVTASYFDKKIDMNLLAPVLAASGSEVVHFAETTNVRFYKTSAYEANTCGFSAALPSTPSDIENKFNDVNTDNGVLGLYLPKNSKGLPSTDHESVITVRSDANKWVLVHEYMHHLFDTQVREGGLSGDQIKEKALSLYESYTSQKSDIKYRSGEMRKAAVKKAATTLKEMNGAWIELLKQYFLEEMTIESLLAEKLQSGELQLVKESQRKNGAYYTLSSAQKTSELIDALENEIYAFKMLSYSDLEYSEYNSFDEDTEKFRDLKSEMTRLSNRAYDYLKGARTGLAPDDGPAEPLPNHAGCSHEKEADEILEIFKNGQDR